MRNPSTTNKPAKASSSLSFIDAAIAAAKVAYPDLGVYGFGIGGDKQFDRAQVETAIEFLRLCHKTKRPKISSYALKHVIENWGENVGFEPYVGNGAAIVAAHALGFAIKQYAGGSPNAAIGVNLKQIVRQRAHEIWPHRVRSIVGRHA